MFVMFFIQSDVCFPQVREGFVTFRDKMGKFWFELEEVYLTIFGANSSVRFEVIELWSMLRVESMEFSL